MVYKSYFQTESWGRFKNSVGWKPERFGEALGMARAIGFGQSMRYFPELAYDQEKIPTIISQLKPGPIFSRLEFLEPYSDEKAAALQKLGLIKSFEDVQPEWRQWVDISKTEAETFAAMKPKGRYNITIGARSGLTITVGGKELIEDFFQVYQYTAKRTNFSGRSLGYFQQLIEVVTNDAVGEIISIKKDDRTLAAGLFIYYGGIASFLYGGSQSVEQGDRALMATYALHWEAMKRAKARGCTIYDLLAVAPAGDENHPYTNLTRFKVKFGGQTVHLLGSWDLVHSSIWYTMYRFAERLRRKKNTS